MAFDEYTPLSRRDWLQRVSVPAAAASVGAMLSTSSVFAASADAAQQTGSRVFNISDFGAKGDGSALSTTAVQAAIDACTAAGGGVVFVPTGVFVVGTLELKSNVTLHLAATGRLLGSADIAHYHAGNGVPPSNGNIVLLSAANAENVAIEGLGTIDGNGAKFYNGQGDNTGPGQNSQQGYFRRPHLLVFYRCKNLRVSDVFLTASAYHCCRILECERVLLTGVRIHNRVNKNNDGFHFNSSRYVHVTNCDVACQDDACALFGSNAFVTISNSTFSTRWSAFRFGGGEAENISITNSVIYETYGCAIKARVGARSRLENVSFSNLIMKDVTGPISIGLDSTYRRKTPNHDDQPVTRGVIRNVSFTGIRATVVGTGKQHADLPFESKYNPGETRSCITLNGVGEDMIEGISFNDVHVTYAGGGTAAEAAQRDVPKIAGEYFEVGTLPAYGLFARNVRGLTLNNIRFDTREPDLRPAFVLENVQDASLYAVNAQSNPEAESLLRFIETRDVLVASFRITSPARVFLRAEGATCADLTIDGGALSKAAKLVEATEGATAAAVKAT